VYKRQAERCNLNLDFKGYHLPEFSVPEGSSAESYLRNLCEQGLSRRYGPQTIDQEARERLDYELDIIHRMGFDTYFLIVWDLCRYARNRDIWYNARGSAAGSIVAYSLDITLVDPLEHGLIFERFLNPGRISMPDIDLDFRDDRRAEMMEYTARKYGDDKVAQIITFGTMGARAAIRDVARVKDIPLNEVDRVAKLIPNVPGKPVTIEEALQRVSEFKQLYDSAPYLKDLIDTAKQMEGVVRSAGTHAAGVIITDKPIVEYIPLHRPTRGAAAESPIKTITQFDMNIVDSLGLLKVDFLGLATLTIMARACKLIRKRHGVNLHLGNIPTDDPQTYELLGRGETAGVFQVEGSGMRRWLMEMKPKELANVIAMVALFRPGPMDFIPGYIRRMHGEEVIEYRHPKLEPIFKETFGYPVYQEQLMFAAMELAGYSAPDADDLRKAIAKKIKRKLQKHRQKFIDGAVKNGISEDTASDIFEDWREFARYGFNKSHAVDYGVIAVQTAYLKTHYTVEYMTALLSVVKNDTSKVALYVADCRRIGIPVGAPDINASYWDFGIEDRTEGNSVIRFGLGAVKNIGQDPVEAILKARESGYFMNLDDFARRVDLRAVGKRGLECLIKVGALDCFGTRIALLDALDRIVAVSTSHFRALEDGQISLFGEHTGVEERINLLKATSEITKNEILNWERELIGLYISDHPLNPVMDVLTDSISHYSGQLVEADPKERVRVAGMIKRIRHHQTKAGQAMGFVTLEDLQGEIELVIFPRTWRKTSKMILVDKIVLVEVRVDSSSVEPKILADRIVDDFSKLGPGDAMPINGSKKEMVLPEADFQTKKVTLESGGNGDILQIKEDQSFECVKDEFKKVSTYIESNQVMESDGGLAEREPNAVISEEQQEIVEKEPVGPGEVEADYLVKQGGGNEKQHILGEDTAHIEVPESVLAKNTSQEDQQDDYEQVLIESDVPAPPKNQVSVTDIATSGSIELPPFIVPPIPGIKEDHQVKMITIVIRSTGDITRDELRLRMLHGVITSYPGNDRFAFHVFVQGRGYLLEFPNCTIGLCSELIDRLSTFVGIENVSIDPIMFQ